MALTDILRPIRLVLWGAAGVAAVVGLTVVATHLMTLPTSTQEVERTYAKPFRLTDQNGVEVTERDFLGKPSAWFYGFTHCPDVCPTALAELTAILEALGPDAEKLNVIFVSVDPERDTPEVLREYVSYFDSRIVGLTGTPEQITEMARSRYIFFEKIFVEGQSDYAMEHQASIQLVSLDGAFFGTLAAEESFATKMAKMRRLIAKT